MTIWIPPKTGKAPDLRRALSEIQGTRQIPKNLASQPQASSSAKSAPWAYLPADVMAQALFHLYFNRNRSIFAREY